MAVLVSLRKDKIEEFETNMIQLRAFYSESKTILTEAPNRYGMIGLYLLFLVYKNRTTDYYTELELLTLEEQKNQYISVALSLEQHFIDGNYHKILHTKQHIPLDIYNYFIDKMIDTVRHEAARSAERAYRSLKIDDAVRIFMLNNAGELEQFVEQQKKPGADNNVVWLLHKDRVNFEPVEKEKITIPAHNVISQSLQFAHELEKIV